MGCLDLISFSFLINGLASSFFKPTRGLQQDCPLSPLLFLINGLSQMFNEYVKNGSIKGIKIGRLTTLSHFLFVDHVLLFGNGTLREAFKFKKILEIYGKATRMEINAQKSAISLNNVPQGQEDIIVRSFSFQNTDFNKSFKYLGFMLNPND
jgi:hypothetical protein